MGVGMNKRQRKKNVRKWLKAEFTWRNDPAHEDGGYWASRQSKPGMHTHFMEFLDFNFGEGTPFYWNDNEPQT
jgi:hypothetical protein